MFECFQSRHPFHEERLLPALQPAMDLLSSGTFDTLEPGRYDYDHGIYAMISTYETAPESAGRYEAHRRYIDIQYLLGGRENILIADISAMQVTEPYQAEKDCVFGQAPGTACTLAAGEFCILLPTDAHMPGQCCGLPETVRKVVIKVPYPD